MKKNTRSSFQSGSSSDKSNMEIAFVTRARSKKREARTIQEIPKPTLPKPAFSVCLLSFIQHG